MPYKPTFDLFPTKEAAMKDAAKRQRQAAQNGSGRRYVVRKTGGNRFQSESWTVMYHEPKG